MEITITAPHGFSFKRTVISHGWYDLPPFEFDEKNWTLSRVIDTGEARPVTAKVSAAGRDLKVSLSRKIGKRAASKIERHVRHMFRLDDDMAAFYEVMAQDSDFEWIAKAGAGRLLRSPTVFEDLVKTISTTNCSWALTKKMIDGLIGSLGRRGSDGRRDFPTPEAMASMTERFYRDEIRAGYRAPYLKELAERVAEGSLDVETWLGSELPTSELKREMKRVKGVGDYAAENLLKLVGRYDVLALDSWVRSTFARIHNGGRASADKKIERYYSRFGEWRGLALWCDMTREWMDRDEQFTTW
ncbi:MAG: Fe-S cluster assembly protein HesB [Blastocatellia bacterium]|nr:Fe-S cluster assembly protein HesB [Blastocatellia bacterium]